MRDLFTGRLRALTQSPDGLLHDAQPPASIGIAAAQLGADGRPLVEPGAFFCDGNYSLAVNSWNALAGAMVTVRLRWLTNDGRLTDSEFVHTPNSNRTKATTLFPLGVGFALNVTVFASAGTPLVGQTFVQVQIVRGLTGALLPVATILQDYVTSVQALAWPGSPIRTSLDVPGVLRQIAGTQPGAGAEISETVPTGARWRLLYFLASLATSAVVATRRPRLLFDNGATVFALNPTAGSQGAGGSSTFYWANGLPLAAILDASTIAAGMPVNTKLLAGFRIRTATIALDVGDQWGIPQYVVEENLEASV